MLSNKPRFRHLKKRDGTWHSICLRCYLTVVGSASAFSEEELKAADVLHVCNVSERDAHYQAASTVNLRHSWMEEQTTKPTECGTARSDSTAVKSAPVSRLRNVNRLRTRFGWLITEAQPREAYNLRVLVRLPRRPSQEEGH